MLFSLVIATPLYVTPETMSAPLLSEVKIWTYKNLFAPVQV